MASYLAPVLVFIFGHTWHLSEPAHVHNLASRALRGLCNHCGSLLGQAQAPGQVLRRANLSVRYGTPTPLACASKPKATLYAPEMSHMACRSFCGQLGNKRCKLLGLQISANLPCDRLQVLLQIKFAICHSKFATPETRKPPCAIGLRLQSHKGSVTLLFKNFCNFFQVAQIRVLQRILTICGMPALDFIKCAGSLHSLFN